MSWDHSPALLHMPWGHSPDWLHMSWDHSPALLHMSWSHSLDWLHMSFLRSQPWLVTYVMSHSPGWLHISWGHSCDWLHMSWVTALVGYICHFLGHSLDCYTWHEVTALIGYICHHFFYIRQDDTSYENGKPDTNLPADQTPDEHEGPMHEARQGSHPHHRCVVEVRGLAVGADVGREVWIHITCGRA